MAKPHYIVRRSRSGRFNFTLITDSGRIMGFVHVPLEGQPIAELKRQARERIRELAVTFTEASGNDEIEP